MAESLLRLKLNSPIACVSFGENNSRITGDRFMKYNCRSNRCTGVLVVVACPLILVIGLTCQ